MTSLSLSMNGSDFRVCETDLLGEGGEARVFRYGSLAVKVFHAAPNVAKLSAFPTGLPSEVVGPVALVADRRGVIVGYAMNAVPNAQDAGRLSSRKRTVSNSHVTKLFAHAQRVMAELHSRRVVIGDFNDGNLLVQSTVLAAPGPSTQLGVKFIDADSMQFHGHPCTVAHEKFLDPRLYGVDLTRASTFSPQTDWYSWAVMLFSSLLFVHPYGGTHAKLPTLLRRAEARHSIFKPDVTWPRLAASRSILPDDVLHWFTQVFERDERTVPPTAMTSMQWSLCTCGVEHARAVCPSCHVLGVPLVRQVIRAKGRCTARTVFETSGRILAAAMQGGLRYAFEANGVVKREDGTALDASALNTELRLAGANTWALAATGSLFELGATGAVAERFSSSLVAASTSAAYRQEADWLIDAKTGARVGQVLEGHTRFWCGERLGLGFYRAGGFTNVFLVRHGRAGLLRVTPQAPALKGRIVEAAAVFDATHALLNVTIDCDGKETTHRFLYADSGVLIASSCGGAKGNAALMNGRVVIATDAGLSLLSTDNGVLTEAVSFTDTQPFVSAGDELLAQPDGSLFVVGPRDITQLTLS